MIYKGYEIFSDSSYYDMIAVRKQGHRLFEQSVHVNTIKQAKAFVDEQVNYKKHDEKL